ncbi:Dps family protein [Salisediminibacterium halotolerans]|uniref:Dps family protein n=1 Tax=Salisediminibacterium halotolerans TaxID=517425 RepID=UPI000EB240E8|nr:Dps family protein [Salisediminibacterium halotolerans]RLJ74338.1 starvation-inducible DNA-binding protein [Actinophytocola xinjiangensis]RPE87569.1 starvation-inducible DNA-binding protein [Salisediminibacterium halotolerans]TWG35175.1 starvation-inducible DNA-binding protein [Salisediminibacterium halotolerans]GEL08614.1 general stress protein 20U [Salisediminibacterium halotolerans]
MARTKTQSVNPKTAEILNRHVANWNVLFVKLHNYHWFIKGPHFFTLHEKFEELYNEAAGHIDELAERLLAVKGEPAATMKEYLNIATIEEAKGETTADEMLNTLIADFEKVAKELDDDVETLEDDAGDAATADMLIALRQSVEKHNWMLRSYLA